MRIEINSFIIRLLNVVFSSKGKMYCYNIQIITTSMPHILLFLNKSIKSKVNQNPNDTNSTIPLFYLNNRIPTNSNYSSFNTLTAMCISKFLSRALPDILAIRIAGGIISKNNHSILLHY